MYIHLFSCQPKGNWTWNKLVSMFDVVVLWLQMAELEKRLAELETAVGSGSDKQVEHCQKKQNNTSLNLWDEHVFIPVIQRVLMRLRNCDIRGEKCLIFKVALKLVSSGVLLQGPLSAGVQGASLMVRRNRQDCVCVCVWSVASYNSSVCLSLQCLCVYVRTPWSCCRPGSVHWTLPLWIRWKHDCRYTTSSAF